MKILFLTALLALSGCAHAPINNSVATIPTKESINLKLKDLHGDLLWIASHANPAVQVGTVVVNTALTAGLTSAGAGELAPLAVMINNKISGDLQKWNEAQGVKK